MSFSATLDTRYLRVDEEPDLALMRERCTLRPEHFRKY
jgi:hypothetical protein